jgi:riboflavin synthase
MFTGLVEATGTVGRFDRTETGARLELSIPFATELELGDSVAVNGCCLTVADHADGSAGFDLLAQTLSVTGLGDLKVGDTVNLERALRADARLGGHFVQGHVDTTAEIRALEPVGDDYRYEVAMPSAFARYLIPKGSIAVDGISLTAAEVDDDSGSFTCWITPHTRAVTNLISRTAGERVNLEFDLLAKHLERFTTYAKS